jgi:hypothetical protein
MRKLIFLGMAWFLSVVFTAAGAFFCVGCESSPSAEVVTVRTLTATGTAAKAVVDGAARAYLAGALSEERWLKVASFYDDRFQPAFRLAVALAGTEKSTPADLLALLADLQTLANVETHP